MPAAFDAEGAENISVDHCMFAQLGNYAISFGRGCFRNRVVSNEMEDLGGGGVKIGEPTMNRQRPNEAERNGNNQVADNHMHRLGLVYPASVGVLLGQSSDNTVSHNHIHDLTYSAISVGWTWQYKLTQLKNNIIEYNHLHDLGHNVMSDMGGIYTLGEQPGTVLRNNLIHDVNALVYGGWGIYLDQATSNIVVEKNVVYKNASGLKILSRKSYEESAGSVFDNPLASRFDENDAVLYFDEVKVPWERVFIAGDIAMCQKQFFATPAHVFQNYQCQIRLMVKLRFLVGLARKIAIINGIDTFPQVRETLGQLAAEAASVEAFVAAMEVKGAPWRTYFVPDRHMLYASQVLTQQLYPKVIHTLRELAGGSMIMLPSGIEDFSDPQISDYVLRAQGSAAVCPKDRVKFFKLAWDAVGSEFASRHTQYEMFYAGAGFVTKGHSHRTYNWEAATGLVDRLLSTYDFPRDVSPAPELTNAR